MFLEFFQLWDEPFGVTPDPAYLYPSQTHLHALDALRNGILGGRGFITLIAEPGMGKTTLLYQLIEQLPQTTRSAYIFQTQCNSLEFIQYLLNEIGVDPNGMGLVAMHRRLNETLFNEMVQGKQFVLIVDESQNLSNAVLETIRLLSNFETAHSKLLQIVLAGQPELANKLKQPDLSQLLQRITVTASLAAFSFEETAAYIRHRLRLAGHTGEDIFDPAALAAVYRRSKGIPRNINRVCHATLEQAAVEQARRVTAAIVEKSNQGLGVTAEELQRSRFSSHPRPVVSGHGPAQTEASRQSAVSRVPTIQPQPPAAAPAVPEPPPAPPPGFREVSQPDPISSQQFPLPQRDFASREPPRRLYAWLGWGVVVAVLFVLAALVAPASVRQALLQTLQPTVGSSSRGDSSPASIGAQSGVAAKSTQRLASPGNAQNVLAQKVVPTKNLTIVIDPAHGGAEPGARGPEGLLEKSVCLEVALRLGQLFEDIPGANIIYTRSDDQIISAQNRAAIANDSSADLLISIHADLTTGKNSPDVYYGMNQVQSASGRSGNRESTKSDSLRLAGDVADAFSGDFRSKGEIQPITAASQPVFATLNSVRAPTVVVNIPFSENDGLLLSPDGRQKIAESLYRGIAQFVKEDLGRDVASPASTNDH